MSLIDISHPNVNPKTVGSRYLTLGAVKKA